MYTNCTAALRAKDCVMKTATVIQENAEVFRIAACLEEHFPHSMAKAVVDAARRRKLYHEEMHSKVEYIVAHGISSYIDGKKAVIGSSHFVFEDEKCTIREEYQEKFDTLPEEYSHLYLAIDGELTAVICIEDLRGIVMLKRLSDAMMRRIQGNYKGIVSINGALIALGVAGLIQPTTSALLHNTSTIAISLRSMKSLLPEA